jgi:hypothetical protein
VGDWWAMDILALLSRAFTRRFCLRASLCRSRTASIVSMDGCGKLGSGGSLLMGVIGGDASSLEADPEGPPERAVAESDADNCKAG